MSHGSPSAPLELLEQPRADLAGLVQAVDVVQEDDELVAAEAGRRVDFPDRLAEAVGDGHEQCVADVVPQAVVDDLEAVEVEEQDGELAIGIAARTADRAHQAVSEELAVRQAGQAILVREAEERAAARRAKRKPAANTTVAGGASDDVIEAKVDAIAFQQADSATKVELAQDVEELEILLG